MLKLNVIDETATLKAVVLMTDGANTAGEVDPRQGPHEAVAPRLEVAVQRLHLGGGVALRR